MKRRYCYHITNGVTRSALYGGTVTAASMEEAAVKAATGVGLTVEHDPDGLEPVRWVENGKRRSVYVLHNPEEEQISESVTAWLEQRA